MDKTDHLAAVRAYDAMADGALVEKIVKHLGVALHNPDSAAVSIEDEKDLDRLAEKWCGKRLGIEDGPRCRAALRLVYETMGGEQRKSRVAFYYLVAKHLGKLDAL